MFPEKELNGGQPIEFHGGWHTIKGTAMTTDFEGTTIDELFALRDEIAEVLTEKLVCKKVELEQRLRLLRSPQTTRRPYPPVKAKFRNPDQPLETWSGRGRLPRWLDAQLRSGKRLDQFRIAS